jgi:protein SCO1
MRLVAAVIAALALAPHASAAPADALPQDVVGVGVTERLDGQVPLDLPLVDEAGQPTTLGAVRRTDRPLLLVLGYYECPMLCTVVLNGVVEALRGIEWVPGREFEVVMLSIDPAETPDLARAKRETYLAAYGRPEARDGWRFLTGPAASIDAIAAAVGFEYRYLPERDEFAHPAVVFVLTPEGRVARYLYGVRFDPRTVRLSLVEAAAGRIGSTVDRVLLTCYRYDPETGRYTPVALGLLRIAAALTALVVLALLVPLWLREARAARRKELA